MNSSDPRQKVDVPDIGRDLFIFSILASASLFLGLLLNVLRDTPLSFAYQSKEQRMEQATSRISQAEILAPQSATRESSEVPLKAASTLTLNDLQRVIREKQAFILDARPEIFFRLGHIPGAISLPRDDFEASYAKLKPTLEKEKSRTLVVYCSSAGCEDSSLLQSALVHLGYTRVIRFAGGWAAWTQAGFPQEKSE